MGGWVYIMECSDRSFYTGVTNDLERREEEHVLGLLKKSYTYSRRPVRLVWSQHFDRIEDAIEAEKKIKRWSHGKKQALIDGDWSLIHELASCRNETNFLNTKIRVEGRDPE